MSTNKDDYHEHQIECSSDVCVIWTTVVIPKTLHRGFTLDGNFICGYCAAKEIENLKNRPLTGDNEPPKIRQESYATMAKNEATMRVNEAMNCVRS